ncbi:OsmC family protein [uncultured Leifsonia sp.]|uniref:OsmC family protein n=1 Tax=uncultured Leifsonia sp. TaxID=340359 RepID=UPI0025ED7DBA|nr:OsmC family protein [uncultured Leifsonia sp.]
MKLEHRYRIDLEWTGNRGEGTSGYKSYGRDHTVRTEGKHAIEGSADRTFFGDRDRWNPEELLLAALSQCHMLSYLAEAARAGVVVVAYTDRATGIMEQTNDGGGHFTSALLRPTVTIADPAQAELAESLHAPAASKCFIAASVNFPVHHAPELLVLA